MENELIHRIKIYLHFPNNNRLVFGYFWSFLGSSLTQLLSLITSIIIARLLGKELFGQLGAIISTISMLGTFAGFGQSITITKYLAEYRSKDKKTAGKILALSIFTGYGSTFLITLLALLISSFIAKTFLSSSELDKAIRIGCILLFCNSVIGIQAGILIGLEKFKTLAIINIVSGVLSFIFECLGSFFLNIHGALFGLGISSLITWILSIILTIKECKNNNLYLDIRCFHSEKKILWTFSFPALLSNLLVVPINWIGNVLLLNSANGFSELGIFNAANQWRTAIVFLPGVISQTILPILSNMFGEDNVTGFKKILATNFVLVFCSALLVSLPLAIFSKVIMGLYGESFKSSYLVLVMICLTAILVSTSSVIGTAISSMGKMWMGFVINSLWALTFIFFSYIFAKNGALGLSKAYVLSYCVHLINSLICLIFLLQLLKKQGK